MLGNITIKISKSHDTLVEKDIENNLSVRDSESLLKEYF